MHGHDAPLVKEGSVVTSGRFIRVSDSSPASRQGRAISDPKIRTLEWFADRNGHRDIKSRCQR